MTCWSCEHYRRLNCYLGRDGWPSIGKACSAFSYEPGSDEAEFLDSLEKQDEETLD